MGKTFAGKNQLGSRGQHRCGHGLRVTQAAPPGAQLLHVWAGGWNVPFLCTGSFPFMRSPTILMVDDSGQNYMCCRKFSKCK